PRAWMSRPEPDWLWSACCVVVFVFFESAVDEASFDCVTEPLLPGLHTRTGSFELPLELQPHPDVPKSWMVVEPDSAAWSFRAFCPSPGMPTRDPPVRLWLPY